MWCEIRPVFDGRASITKGFLFCQKWCTNGVWVCTSGWSPPFNTLLTTSPPGTGWVLTRIKNPVPDGLVVPLGHVKEYVHPTWRRVRHCVHQVCVIRWNGNLFTHLYSMVRIVKLHLHLTYVFKWKFTVVLYFCFFLCSHVIANVMLRSFRNPHDRLRRM